MAARSRSCSIIKPLTLFVALATVAVTALLYMLIPKGFFPVQDVGLIQAISEGPQSASFSEMTRLQGELADAILKDPDVESLSSFIGVDGTNQTPNAGRFLIALKPFDQRSLSASADHSQAQAGNRRGRRAPRSTCSRCRI